MCSKNIEDIGNIVFCGTRGTEGKVRGAEGGWAGERKHKEIWKINIRRVNQSINVY